MAATWTDCAPRLSLSPNTCCGVGPRAQLVAWRAGLVSISSPSFKIHPGSCHTTSKLVLDLLASFDSSHTFLRVAGSSSILEPSL